MVMQGMDKKSLNRLQAMLGLETIKAGDRQLMQDLNDRYEAESPHFFTSKQRKLIDSLYETYFDRGGNALTCRWDAKDRRLRDDLIGFIETGDVPKAKLSMAESLADWCCENQMESGITQGRRAIMVEIVGMAKNHGKQQGFYDELLEKFESDEGIVNGSAAFAESVLKWFEEKGFWTEVQQEHIEKMLADNADPED
jgi:hypothetical protein